jgi:hypothetical protein
MLRYGCSFSFAEIAGSNKTKDIPSTILSAAATDTVLHNETGGVDW